MWYVGGSFGGAGGSVGGVSGSVGGEGESVGGAGGSVGGAGGSVGGVGDADAVDLLFVLCSVVQLPHCSRVSCTKTVMLPLPPLPSLPT